MGNTVVTLCLSLFLSSGFLLSPPSWGHQNEKHHPTEPAPQVVIAPEQAPGNTSKELTLVINSLYLKEVKAIFRIKCLDCHGSGTPLPWYSKVPGIQQIIESDTEEAKLHLDMNEDFPFGGHGSPEEDLVAIQKSIENSSMPPLRYKLLHWNSSLSSKEKETIAQWVQESLKVLAPEPKTE